MSILSPNFTIGNIRIGSIEGASCMNMGNNFPTNFENHKKHNQGFGSVGGDNNTIRDGTTVLNDPDFIDLLDLTNNEDVPEWIKEMINKALNTENGEEGKKNER